MSRAPGTPKVSVCVITYNQEAFIGPCLQSIVDQKTDFDFEIIVGEDASTDGTRRVVQSFCERYPGLIRPIYQERNIGGGAHNFKTVHLAARGLYVAHMDGDDMMLPGKLQAQADTLDTMPDVALAAHAVKVIDSQHTMGADDRYPACGSVYDLLRLGAYFVHSSVMYRRNETDATSFPDACIDYYMHIRHASRGGIFLDRRPLGAYRSHGAGLSQDMATRERMERHYEVAFDHALELGLDRARVEAARLDRRMKFAIARRLAGDRAGYLRMIRLRPGERQSASLKHKFLHATRWFSSVVPLYFMLKGVRVQWAQRLDGRHRSPTHKS